jgi:uncharacterized protein (DUF849 family)
VLAQHGLDELSPFHGLAAKVSDWKFPWEKKYIEDSEAFIFRNTFRDITRVYQLMAEGHGTRFEHECYDIGHLYNLAYFLDRDSIKPPLWMQSIFGILGGIGADPDNVTFMRRTADRLFGDDYVWSVLAAGRQQMPLITQAAMMGGNVRVGLEDSLYIGRGKLAATNAEQVLKIRASSRNSASVSQHQPRPGQCLRSRARQRAAGARGRAGRLEPRPDRAARGTCPVHSAAHRRCT